MANEVIESFNRKTSLLNARAGVFVSLEQEGLYGVPFLVDFSLKLITNAITTGGMILRGRVYGNRMINLTVSNNKLFHRSIKIIQEITRGK